MAHRSLLLASTLLILLGACGEPSTVPDDAGAPVAEDASTQPDAGPQLELDCPARPGPSSNEPIEVSTARMISGVRFFAPNHNLVEDIDVIVARTLADHDVSEPAFVEAFAEYAPVSFCATGADDTELGPASIEIRGDTALVRPGTGSVEIPDEVTAVMIDVRDLPSRPESESALREVLRQVLRTGGDISHRVQYAFAGLPYDGTNPIWNNSVIVVPITLEADSRVERTIALLTSEQMSPAIAGIVGGLRIERRAWIAGAPVSEAAAAQHWSPVGTRGLSWRDSELRASDVNQAWPEEIGADHTDVDVELFFGAMRDWGAPPAATLPPASEKLVQYWYVFQGRAVSQEWIDVTTPLTRPNLQAMLLAAFGVADRFYAYIDEVGGHATLPGALVAAYALSRELEPTPENQRRLLATLLGPMNDGHMYYGRIADPPARGYLPLQLDFIEDQIVVRASAAEGVSAGDVITAIDGQPAAEWLTETLELVVGATIIDRRMKALALLREVGGSQPDPVLTVRGPSGESRDLTISLAPFEAFPYGGTFRESGFLTEEGLSDVYFLNLNRYVTTEDNLDATLSELRSARALIIDMRDYPGVDHYAIARALRRTALALSYSLPRWLGPDIYQFPSIAYRVEPDGEGFAGEIVFLTGPKAISASEHLLQMFFLEDNVTTVGQPTAGTNGNRNTAVLPAGAWMSFTGLNTPNADGSSIHNRGIPVDVLVETTLADIVAGNDPDLATAMELLAE